MSRGQLDLFGTGAPAPAESDGRGAAPVDGPRDAAREIDAAGGLPDAAARERIARDLETDLLVEAGAGSGKTTALVGRMVALVRTGTAEVTEIAAVTFTRKAAGELRERFQGELERALAEARADGEAEIAARLDAALREIDRAFVGTIHAFCARLLRERPLEAGLDPSFTELEAHEELRLIDRFWGSWRERLAADGDPILDELARVGLRPEQLRELFVTLDANPDVDFPADAVPAPSRREIGEVRRELERLLDEARGIMPTEEPAQGWDDFQSRLRSLTFSRWVLGWDSDLVFLEALAGLCAVKTHKTTQSRWGVSREIRAHAKALSVAFTDFAADGGHAQRLVAQWWAHRYPVALRFARDAARAFAAERRRTSHLTFQDLLVHTASLLRRSHRARRDLGRRWRRLLVDEFQDTDPLQAEILLLLASPSADPDWRNAVPRPGALFVVGDPKQSIYRFRRADISVYNDVRRRFQGFGAVVSLTTNFRSRPAIGELVDDVFGRDGRFPAEATERQAAFAPLRTRPVPEGAPRGGVFDYELSVAGRGYAEAADDDAERVAGWIAERVASGERGPGDFLVLTRNKPHLERYARALEARDLPVQVAGASVSIEQELDGLTVLLEALADPGDPLRVVTALIGLFFGLDHERLLEHRLAGGGFDPTRGGDAGHPDVLAALRTIGRWSRLCAEWPADSAVGAIVDELGLLPHAAAGELGSLRAGAMGYALDAIRAAAMDGATSLPAALDALRGSLAADEAEAPLEPGRADVVRLMNLHKAKGLEAPVVVLAAPFGNREHPPDMRVERLEDGTARGYLLVQERDRRTMVCLARPLDWPAHAEAEAAFQSAEDDRLLYVATTRAGVELLVARDPAHPDRSPWKALHPWLDRAAGRLELPRRAAPPRRELETPAAEIAARGAAIAAERRRRAVPGYTVTAVTRLVGETSGEDVPQYGGGTATGAAPILPREPGSNEAAPGAARGLSWGRALHGALEAAARGADGERLRLVCRALLLENERPERDGEPTELDELVATVAAVRASPLWERAERAEARLAEVPFAWPVPAEDPAGPRRVVEGVIDLAFRETDGWVLVDYKSDRGDDAGFPTRLAAYASQLRSYAKAWEALTREPVRRSVLFFTARGDEVEVT